ncbi:MAG: phage major capsid protein, partial [Ruminiclostridium sp.]|nr:phage major capsid protein [Ruminiclostridium sp.]
EVKTKEHLVSLTKRGRMLVASYEAIRFQKLDLFGVMLRQIGAHIQKQQLADAVKVIIQGDGNDNAAVQYTVGTSPISGAAGSLGYDQLVEFWGQFDPYTMNTILCSTATMTKLLKVPELQNPMTGLNFQGTGKLTTPLGAQLHRTAAVADGMIIGLDNRYALELVRAGDVLVEYDKLIDRQLERAAITSISGFGKICDGAACVLNV